MDDRRRAFIGEQKIELVYASSKWPTPDLGYSSLRRLISNHLYATVTDPPPDTMRSRPTLLWKARPLWRSRCDIGIS
jgi:hypothetical protein